MEIKTNSLEKLQKLMEEIEKPEEDIMGFCDWCGKERELIKEGEARICWLCKSNQTRKFGKEVKATTADNSKVMKENAYGEFILNSNIYKGKFLN